jgi:hypothetical protein
MCSAYTVLVEKLEGKTLFAKHKRRWGNNVSVYFTGMGCEFVEWICGQAGSLPTV